ncbi:PREDICTED: uncharacterized protein At4g04775-like [Camelina sativa]|uniref:Uncharacterized protein At4g04775-like n=1 Tax=Camelina sativa TaxID=90675 RepID=A0ABM0U6G9_CAMSA|nr:PREDICTED: uncharacterized protein At4g04775-like [Camelina sativa]
MSNVSGASSCASNVQEGGRGKVVGVPKRCWIGEVIVAKNSKSETNPCRRYFRCGYAAAKKLMNDDRIFKWVDEALLDEVDYVTLHTVKLQMEMEIEKKMKMELEKELFERVEDAKSELRSRMKMMIVVIVFGCMIMFGLFKIAV